jgi:beta-phosphoglucomutase-like phosphatase (HAD superfamily)
MNIALFDIDGTLTASNAVDSACRADAFHDVFGFRIHTKWIEYKHVTDRGIATQAFKEKHHRDPTEDELSLDRARCVQLLEVRMKDLKEIPGAGAFLARLLARHWRVVLCTGAWGNSARLKLAQARLPTDLPLVSCDDEISREGILRLGMELAGASANDVIVSFGDAPWDVQAAANLKLPFIGIGGQSGAAEAFEDFRNASAVFAAVDRISESSHHRDTEDAETLW